MQFKSLIDNSKAASSSSGKCFASQIFEIIRLRLGPSKLGADDYYLYELHDDKRFTFKQKTQFLGWRRSKEIDRILNSDEWRVYANDKVKFSEAMSSAGLRVPKIYAIYSEQGPPPAEAQLLNSDKQIANFFVKNQSYPVFCKPVHGTYGRGGFSALSFDSRSNSLEIGDGSVMQMPEVALQFKEKWAEGYIVQELLTPHHDVEALIGGRLSSLRIVVLKTASGPQIHRATWRLPVGRNMSNNFMYGKLGNLIANVDTRDGLVGPVMGVRDGKVIEVPKHPDTQIDLRELKVPLWAEIVDFSKEASSLFPGLALQHWDVAICPDGPVALEVNVEGGLDSTQLAGKRGFWDKALCEVVTQSQSI